MTILWGGSVVGFSAFCPEIQYDMDICSFQKGDFVIDRKDAYKLDSYPIWRIENGKLLQKFDPSFEDGILVHKSASVVSLICCFRGPSALWNFVEGKAMLFLVLFYMSFLSWECDILMHSMLLFPWNGQLVMYQIQYFFKLKYFMKYFGNISVFNEIFQNTVQLCLPRLFLSHRATAQNLMMLNTCIYVIVCYLLHAFYFRPSQIICDFNFQLIKSEH